MNRATLWVFWTELHRQIFSLSLLEQKLKPYKYENNKKLYFALVAWHVSEWNVWGIQKMMCPNSKRCCPCSHNSNKYRKLSQTSLLSATKVIHRFFFLQTSHSPSWKNEHNFRTQFQLIRQPCLMCDLRLLLCHKSAMCCKYVSVFSSFFCSLHFGYTALVFIMKKKYQSWCDAHYVYWQTTIDNMRKKFHFWTLIYPWLKLFFRNDDYDSFPIEQIPIESHAGLNVIYGKNDIQTLDSK